MKRECNIVYVNIVYVLYVDLRELEINSLSLSKFIVIVGAIYNKQVNCHDLQSIARFSKYNQHQLVRKELQKIFNRALRFENCTIHLPFARNYLLLTSGKKQVLMSVFSGLNANWLLNFLSNMKVNIAD